MTITSAASTPADFRLWRKSVHNAVAYQRRRSRWWRTFGIWAWCDRRGARGVISLGSITPTEFGVALRRYGETQLRPIEAENIRTEVYAAAMSLSAASGPRGDGRYQPFKIAIEPVTVAALSTPPLDSPTIKAMPWYV